eukprot:1427310-Amphidinium_carterae.1
MYNRLDGDVNLFYDSDCPPRLLLDPIADDTPEALPKEFVVLSPQTATDPSWCDGTGVWFKKGYFTAEDEEDDEAAVQALWEILSRVLNECSIDRTRIYVSGHSMGGYGCLKLALRWPSFFAAIAPVAAHYEEDLDELVETLTSRPMPPFWFIQATNDTICKFKPMKKLVNDLQWRSSTEVKLSDFEEALHAEKPRYSCCTVPHCPVVCNNNSCARVPTNPRRCNMHGGVDIKN